MSFIRCTSNPEGLYIWHDVGGYIALTGSATGMAITPISLRDWGMLKRFYRENPWGDINGKRIQVTHDVSATENPLTSPKVRLSIKRKNDTWLHVYLWEVTYHYFMNNAISR